MTDIEKFEKAVLNAYEKMCAGKAHLTPYTNHVKDAASELLALAREGYVCREEKWDEVETTAKNEFLRGYEEGKKEYESLPKVRGWVARDMDGELNFFGAELGDGAPIYNGDLGVWGNATDNKINISRESGPFGDLNYYDDPVEVELLVRRV